MSLVFAAGAQAAFTATSSTVPAGSAPVSVGIAVLNSDGRADLASADAGDNTLALLLKDAAGSGYTSSSVPADGFPVSLAIGKLNADNRPDIAVANTATDKITVLLKTASGYTSSSIDLPEGSAPTAVAIGDLNNDSLGDIAVATGGTDSVTVLLKDASGTDYTQSKIDLEPASGPVAVAIGDLNGDSKLDIATADSGAATASILLNNGSGNAYTVSTAGSTGGLPTSVAVGDLNGDGRLDIVTADSQSDTVTLLLKDAAGTGYTASSVPVGPALPVPGYRPQGVVLGDLDSDGQLDIATANAASSTATVLLKDAAGSGYTASSFSTGADSFPLGIAIGDLNKDGRLDLATANSNSDTLTLLTNTTAQASKVTLTASPASSQFGQKVTFSAKVTQKTSPAGAGPTPTGTVTFTVDGRQLAPTALSAGVAKLPTSALGVGSHTITADYSGDSNYAASTATIPYTVGATTTITGNVSGPVVVSGRTFISGAHITGSVYVSPGAYLDMENSTVSGVFRGPITGALRVCGSTIGGEMSFRRTLGLAVVGDVAGIQCAVNSITGALIVQNNMQGVRVIGNQVGGTVTATGNAGPGPFPGDPTLITGNGP